MENYVVTYRFEDGHTGELKVVAGSFGQAIEAADALADRGRGNFSAKWNGFRWVVKVELDDSWAGVAS